MTCDIRYQILLNGKPDADATNNAASIEVIESVREESTFTVVFSTDIDGDRFCLKDDPNLLPGKDKLLSVVAEVEGESSVLVHGLIIDRDATVKHGGPGSSITVKGSDRRVLMDRNHAPSRTHKGKIGDVVRAILADGKYHFETKVEDLPCEIAGSEQEGRAAQTMSDLQLVKRLAGMVGAEFWIDWELSSGLFKPPKVVETAHFETQPPRNEGPKFGSIPIPILIAPKGAPEIKLNTNDKETTVLEFQTSRTTEVPRKSGPIKRLNQRSGRLESTNTEAAPNTLGELPDIPDDLQRSVVSAGNVSMARCITQGALNDAAWTVSATVTTSAYGIGGLLRPRQVVKVSGAGDLDDGDYFVWKVTHNIDSADHKMSVELRRNAVGES